MLCASVVADSTCWAGIGQLVHAKYFFDHVHRALIAASHACAERQGQW